MGIILLITVIYSEYLLFRCEISLSLLSFPLAVSIILTIVRITILGERYVLLGEIVVSRPGETSKSVSP